MSCMIHGGRPGGSGLADRKDNAKFYPFVEPQPGQLGHIIRIWPNLYPMKPVSKSVLITGVSTGIGYGAAKQFIRKDPAAFLTPNA